MSSTSINSWLAFDIGGANIKAADGHGWSYSEPFAMWQEWKRLPDVLAHIKSLRPSSHYAVTMTGEIADCFSGRSAGVKHIVGSCSAALGKRDVVFYCVNGSLLGETEATHQPLQVAASNWHALARLAGSIVSSGRSWLIDIGSTTTDIVPLACGQPVPQGTNDWDRLLCGELVYTGMERTPVPVLRQSLPHRGDSRPVACECFATSHDVWLLLGVLPEDTQSSTTADHKPATRDAARVRMARSMLLEPASFTFADAIEAATAIADSQTRLIQNAMGSMIQKPLPEDHVVLSGQGEMLARRVLDHMNWNPQIVSLKDIMGADLSRVAPAHAVAKIAQQIL